MKGLIITLFDSRHFAYRKINSEGFFLERESNKTLFGNYSNLNALSPSNFIYFVLIIKPKQCPEKKEQKIFKCLVVNKVKYKFF